MESARPTWRSRAWLVAMLVVAVLLLALATVGIDRPVAGWIALGASALIIVSVLGWAFVRSRSQREQYEDDLAAWAAERATQTERLRIAADLHDLVSHGLGLITVRAAAARSMTGSHGEAERMSAVTDIEHTSRETTTELRRMLGVLRTPGMAPLRPADTLNDLPSIITAANTAGLTATLDLDAGGDVSPGAQLTICAIVREALNNTLRHAGPTTVYIGVHRNRDTIAVDVHDAGPREGWHPQPGAGHGLNGLRERVTALGGNIQTHGEGNGFQLTARFPDQKNP